MIVLAPKNVQELADLTIEAFDLADRYGLFVLVLGDQLLAIASEQYVVPEPAERPPREVEFGQGNGLVLPELVAVDETAGDFAALERVGRRWEQKFAAIERDEPRAERTGDDGTGRSADRCLRIAWHGSPSTPCLSSAPSAFASRVIRPITLWPFPADAVVRLRPTRASRRRRRAQHGPDDPRRRRGDRPATRRVRQLARRSRSVDGRVRQHGSSRDSSELERGAVR